MSWETIKLIDVCDFQGGTQPPKSSWSTDNKPGYIRMLQIRDFTQGKDSFIEYVKDIKTLKKCNSDDILIGRYGASIGKILTGLSGAYNVALVKTVPTKKISRRYLYFYLLSDTFQNFIQNAGSRAAQAGFNKEELSKLNINLPPIHIQEQIVETLDNADALCKKDQELITKYEELIRSIYFEFISNITSEEKTLEEVAERSGGIRCGPFGTQLQVSSFKKTGVHLWGIKHVNRQFKIITDEFISEEKALELSNYTIIPGDLVMTRKGTIGNVCVYPDDLPIGIMHSDLLRIRLNTDLACSTYIQLHLQYDLTIKEEIKKISHGAIMAGINVSKLKKLKVKIPALKDQKEFSEKIKKINQIINNSNHVSSYSLTLFKKLSTDLMS